jgi:hypothetical protein
MRDPQRRCPTSKAAPDSLLTIQANPSLAHFPKMESGVVFLGRAAARWMGYVGAIVILFSACEKQDSLPPNPASAEIGPACAPGGEPGELDPVSKAANEQVRPRYPLQENPLAGCSICHVDVEDELVASRHFEEEIGCQTCHGPSEGHLADENNEVAPDELFARADTDRLCGDCHECGRPDSGKDTANREHPICTDCHDPHTLELAAPGSLDPASAAGRET